jgi:mRNA interferase MazF
MIKPGDVVLADVVGATVTKRRPVVVVSSDDYHRERPDVILGVLTTRTKAAVAKSDYMLQDWRAAGLHAPSAFRSYFGMEVQTLVQVIGHLSDRDWNGVKDAVRKALA